jgi:hypothetical protein
MRLFCFFQFPIVAIICAVLIAIVRFSHPQMTETQLFLNFCPLYGITVIVGVLSVFLFERALNGKIR